METPPTQFIKAAFFDALDRPPAERRAFLDERCAADPGARRRVEQLLAAEAGADALLGTGGADPLRLAVVATAPPRDLAPGSMLGPYCVTGVAGSGGFGTVYDARQNDPVTRRVALKVLRQGLDSPEARARFDAERQALARMEHASIARVLDAGTTDDGRPYLAMEFVDGVPITSYCEERELGLTERLELFRSVCQAVQHAHQKGVVHRDIKPSNVLATEVDGAPAVKVIDFGIAKALGAPLTELSFVSIEGRLVGTPAYMSPEQAAGEIDVDTRTDVYALGVLLYELLAGAPPFRVDDLGLPELFRAIAERDPRRPSDCLAAAGEGARDRPRVPRDLDWIVMRCLEKDRARRYSSVGALVIDVGRFLDGLPVDAAPPSRTYRLRKLARRHRFAFATSVALVLALAGGVAGTSIGLLRARAANTNLSAALTRAAEEARNARQQWEVADAVNRFVTDDLLAAAAPSSERGRGRDVRLREVLDVAAERIGAQGEPGGRFADKPLVAASIQDMIGRVYGSLDESGPAIAHLERAHALRVAELGPEHTDTLASASALADELRHAGDLERAEALISRVVDARRRALGPEHAETIDAERLLGRLRRAQGRFAEAYEVLRGAHERAVAALGAAHPTAIETLGALAIAADADGREVEAERCFREVLARCRESYGGANPETVAAMNNLGGYLRTAARFEEAEPLLEEAYERQREILGPEHHATLSALYNLGFLALERGDPVRAETLMRRVLAGWEATLGSDHADTVRAMAGVANALLDQGRLAEGEELLARSLDVARRALGADHPVTDSRRKELAAFLYHQPGRADELRPLLEESLESQRRSLGPDHPNTLRALANLALVESRDGDLGRAEELLLEVLERFRATRDEDHLDVLVTESDLADLYLTAGRFEEAEALARHTVEAGVRTLSPEARELGRFRLRWALVLRALRRDDEARDVLTQVAALAESRGPDDILVRFALQELASLPPERDGR